MDVIAMLLEAIDCLGTSEEGMERERELSDQFDELIGNYAAGDRAERLRALLTSSKDLEPRAMPRGWQPTKPGWYWARPHFKRTIGYELGEWRCVHAIYNEHTGGVVCLGGIEQHDWGSMILPPIEGS